MDDIVIAETLDLRGIACPENFVRITLALEDLDVGQVLEVSLEGQEAISNVPRSVKQAGHTILKAGRLGEGLLRLLIRKEVT